MKNRPKLHNVLKMEMRLGIGTPYYYIVFIWVFEVIFQVIFGVTCSIRTKKSTSRLECIVVVILLSESVLRPKDAIVLSRSRRAFLSSQIRRSNEYFITVRSVSAKSIEVRWRRHVRHAGQGHRAQ